MNTIFRLYTELSAVVPEYMAAINICLVKGWLRPATLIEPDKSRGVRVDFSAIESIVHKYGLASVRWDSELLLVYQPDVQEIVDKVIEDRGNHHAIGELLGYKCPGDLYVSSKTRYQINFIVRNPNSGNENPFIGYICVKLSQSLLDDLIEEGKEYSKFLRVHGISSQVKLKIWHYTGFNGGEKTIADDFNQWL